MIYRFKREIEERVYVDDEILRKELSKSNYIALKDRLIVDTFGSWWDFCKELNIDDKQAFDMSIEDIYNWLKINDKETFYDFDSQLYDIIIRLLEDRDFNGKISSKKVYIKDE